MIIRNIKLSKTSAMHYYKLMFRSSLFLFVACVVISDRLHHRAGNFFSEASSHPRLLLAVWILFFGEILLRFFPSSIESRGCQKVFRKNYRPAPKPQPLPKDGWRVAAIGAAWFTLNGLIGTLYHLTEFVDEDILLLVALAYSICDMVCILFFCPFQTWFLGNKCCGTCRIYNWDYAMICTPFAFMHHWFTNTLLLVSVLLLIRWEVTRFLHPERFYEETNEALTCKNCTEKLCTHKKQLQRLHVMWRKKFGHKFGR